MTDMPQSEAWVCEMCDREKRPEEHDWVVGSDGEDLCPSCVHDLMGMEREARAKLPKRIGLCPEHAPEFYYPLRDDEEPTCPTCSREMVVYVQEEDR